MSDSITRVQMENIEKTEIVALAKEVKQSFEDGTFGEQKISKLVSDAWIASGISSFKKFFKAFRQEFDPSEEHMISPVASLFRKYL